jgi:hypothetical protein
MGLSERTNETTIRILTDVAVSACCGVVSDRAEIAF